MQLSPQELRRFDRELLRYFTRRTGSPELAEDLRQEVWLAARHYRGEGPPKNFLRAVAHRQLVNHLRQKHRHPAPLPADISSPRPSPEHRALQHQSHRALHTALTAVPEPFRRGFRTLSGSPRREPWYAPSSPGMLRARARPRPLRQAPWNRRPLVRPRR
ncbi:sigma-70 family RNA polymerase sigma factor [Plesiocystis pacifica]|uniref:RNA polymerase sigma factor n=1 Tax=Plesiocystis pacifica TaxID=191768 RepID=UPI000A313E0D